MDAEAEALIQRVTIHNEDMNARARAVGRTYHALMIDICSCRNREELIIHAVKLLIARGHNLNVRNRYGYTPLHSSINENSIILAHALIRFGIDINAQTNDGMTAIMMAAQNGQLDLVNVLIQNGANVNMQSSSGLTALICCASKETEIAEKIIDAGADINATDEDGDSALIYAWYNDNEAICRRLISLGADICRTKIVSSRLKHKSTNLIMCASRFDSQMVLDHSYRNDDIASVLAARAISRRSYRSLDQFDPTVLETALCMVHLRSVYLSVAYGTRRRLKSNNWRIIYNFTQV